MNMMVDEDYMGLMSDTLFSTITNQPFVFPDSREIAKAGLADFIQPSLGPLQPNLEDYMDTFDPLQEFLSSRLPTVPEENQTQHQQSVNWNYIEHSITSTGNNLQVATLPSAPQIGQYQLMPIEAKVPVEDTRQQAIAQSAAYGEMILNQPLDEYVAHQAQPSPYTSTVISKCAKPAKSLAASRGKPAMQTVYSKSLDNIYPAYAQQSVMVNDRLCIPVQDAGQSQQAGAQQQVQELVQAQFKLVQASHEGGRQTQGYKFPVPAAPNIKFTSPQVQHPQTMQPPYPSQSQYITSHAQKEEKSEPRRRGAPRGRGRSRSNPRELMKRPPPLISAVSDTSLITPQTSVLLTQLLANNSDTVSSLYNQSQGVGARDILAGQIRIKEETSSVPILPQPCPHGPDHPRSVSINAVQPSTSDPLLLNTFSNSNSPVLEAGGLEAGGQQAVHSPTSSQGSIGSPNREASARDRRVGHIHAEQKRRYNIKNGFDMIHSLIPHLNQNPNAKLSKAAMLQKGAEYIRQLRAERSQLKEEMDSLRQQIESLNTSISNCQSMLPATGAPVSRRRDSKMQEMFDEYVRTRTMDNWKFMIFSLIFRPLLNSFNNFVSTSSLDDLYSSTLLWIEQHCTLVDLRPVVLNSLRYLCTKTDILSEPDKLPDEARQMVLADKNQNN
ncbi:hypothetical protein NQ318_020079 [Aromia moschata]|uniref:BHLH domain-containing protein n=1 Tax=Aromia moschata TaxID=1265417 RepID=A0AAV8ZB21_9CUCU|nr:hypothetical protein NQ318_020079 [Aromia moschata]